MNTKTTSFTVSRASDLIGGFGKRKRFLAIIKDLLSDKILFQFQFPATVMVTEDKTCITEIVIANDEERIVYAYPVCKNGRYQFDEISESKLDKDTLFRQFRIFNNGLFFHDNRLFDNSAPDPRRIGTFYPFHEIMHF